MKQVIRSSAMAFLVCFCAMGVATADTGVSDSRVSLPEGPGSLEGVGENVEIDPNMGNMQYSVGIDVPEGFPDVTPSLSLSYSSGNGASLVGMGWGFSVPKIERSKSRRLPLYNQEDFFVANGGNELVYVAGDQATTLPCVGGRVYRARIEEAHTRYTWCDSDGENDYWISESNGTLAYFGADKDGAKVPTARAGKSEAETFRYHLVDTVDIFGHHMHHHYFKDNDLPTEVAYLESIKYNFRPTAGGAIEGDTARYAIDLNYEKRQDGMADCQGGYEEIMSKRLKNIEISVDNTPIRTYKLTYEPDSGAVLSGGFTRLQKVEKFGKDGTPYPAVFSFEYTAAIKDASESRVLSEPFDFDNTSGFFTGKMTLIDMNGDSLPDILDTDGGDHELYLNEFAGDTVLAQHFQAPKTIREGASDYKLGINKTKVLDFDGDGDTDIGYFKNSSKSMFLKNNGSGTWEETAGEQDSDSRTTPTSFIADGSCKFIDADNDKRIDCMQFEGDTLNVYFNDSDPNVGWKKVEKEWDCPTWRSDGEFFDLADLNGDGMLDATIWDRNEETLRYKINLGRGDFKPGCDTLIEFEDTNQSLGSKLAEASEDMEGALAENRIILEDLNNDGLNDIVYVTKSNGFDDSSTIHYWLNKNSEKFLNPYSITGLPSAKTSTSTTASDKVLFADMNANGSTDIVFFSHDKTMEYIDLFPDRPHLIHKIRNGLGQVTQITFEPSINFLARDLHDGNEWQNALSFPQQVVARLEVWEQIAPDLIDQTDYVYHDGYYDGDEKQFRGYQRVEEIHEGDESEAPGRVESFFDVGAPDPSRLSYRSDEHAPYWNGKLLWQNTSGGVDVDGNGQIDQSEKDLPVMRTIIDYHECTVSLRASEDTRGCSPAGRIGDVSLSDTDLNGDGKNDAVFQVQTVATETILKEGLIVDNGDWHTLVSESTYDGFGNLVYREDSGSETMEGDESYSFSRYVPLSDTSGHWMTGLLAESYGSGSPLASAAAGKLPAILGSLPSLYEHLKYSYDDKGQQIKAEARMDKVVSDTGVISNQERFVVNSITSYDSHGNVSFMKNALDQVRGYHYDADFMRATAAFLGVNETSYLCHTRVFDEIWAKPTEGSGLVRVDGALTEASLAGLTCPTEGTPMTKFDYDEYGRVTKKASPGDTLAMPTEAYEYHLGLNKDGNPDPVNAVRSETVTKKRTVSGQPYDLESIRCDNGRGKTYQTLHKIKDENGADKNYQAIGFVVYNKQGKSVKTYQPYLRELNQRCDASEPSHGHTTTKYDGSGRVIKTTYPDGTFSHTTFGPLKSSGWDESGKQTDVWTDGAQRVIAVQRPQLAGHNNDTRYMEVSYDGLSRLIGATDAAGHEKTQSFDLNNQILDVQGPNIGRMWFQYDKLGQVVRRGDARGVVIAIEYDALNRKVREFDVDDAAGTERRWYYDTPQEGCVNDNVDQCTNPAGKVVKMTFPSEGCSDNGICSEWYGYLDRGMLAYQGRTLPETNGFLFKTTSTYDNVNRLTNSVYPDGRSLDFSYDGSGRFVGMHHRGLELVNVEYNAQSLVETQSYGNSVVDSFTYDQRLREKTRKTVGRNGDYQRPSYTRDDTGNILKVDDASSFNDFWKGDYQYDDWNRLTSATLSSAGETIPFQYNDIDNIVKRGDLTYEYSNTNKPNAILQAGDLAYEYNNAGYMTTRGTTRLTWDSWGHLVGAKDGQETLGEFVYGMEEERLLKVEPLHDGWSHTVSDSFEVHNGVAVITPRLQRHRIALLEDPGFATSILPDQNDDDKIRVNDAWLLGSDDERLQARLVSASVERLLAAERPLFLHHDHLGSVTVATDHLGALKGRRSYYPFGGIKEEVGYLGPYGFTGQEKDASTDLVHFKFRHLDTTSGRWINVDPAFFMLSAGNIGSYGEATTAYAYVANQTINRYDPSGLSMKSKLKSAKGKLGKLKNKVMGSKVMKSQLVKGVGKILSAPVDIVRGVVGVVHAGLGGGKEGAKASAVGGLKDIAKGLSKPLGGLFDIGKGSVSAGKAAIKGGAAVGRAGMNAAKSGAATVANGATALGKGIVAKGKAMGAAMGRAKGRAGAAHGRNKARVQAAKARAGAAMSSAKASIRGAASSAKSSMASAASSTKAGITSGARFVSQKATTAGKTVYALSE